MPQSVKIILRLAARIWVWVLAGILCVLFMQNARKTARVPIALKVDKGVSMQLAQSTGADDFAAIKRFGEVSFGEAALMDTLRSLTHSHYSGWYKLSLDCTPPNMSIDFFQYETVEGVDGQGNRMKRFTQETDRGMEGHRRHLIFDLPASDTGGVFLFKVFVLKWQPKDSLSVEMRDTRALYAQIYEEFYHNQDFPFWIMFIFGIGGFQLMYIGGLAWSRRKMEYVYYFLFVMVGLFYVMISRRFELGYIGQMAWVTSSVLTYFPIFNFFYCRFIRYYLDTGSKDTFIDRQYRMGEAVMLGGTLVNLLIYLTTGDLSHTYAFFQPFSVAVILIDVYLLLLLYRMQSPLVRYLTIGAALLVITTAITLPYKWLLDHGYIDYAVDLDIYIGMVGMIIDAVVLNMGLNFKHRMEILEKERMVEEVRADIARDLHDSVGTQISSIRLSAELAKLEPPNTNHRYVEQIILITAKLVDDIRDIVWAISDKRVDKLEHVAQRIGMFAQVLLEEAGIEFSIQLPQTYPAQSRDIPQISHLYFIAKEALNNAFRYAQATRIAIALTIGEGGEVTLEIRDNGCGFDVASLKQSGMGGNGLHNMNARAQLMGGELRIDSVAGEGTCVGVVV